MICHFQGGSAAGRGAARGRRAHAGLEGARPIPASATGAMGSELHALPPSPGLGPLAPVLAGLVGREVTLLAGGRLHTGRLVQGAPVTLVDAAGRTSVIAAPVISVQF